MYIPADRIPGCLWRRRSSLQHQRGAALMVGLIMLLLLTLIGVAGMRDTLLQEKMVGNMMDREMALQAAESALREAEGKIAAVVAPNSLAVDGIRVQNALVRPTNKTESAFWQSQVWGSGNSAAYAFFLPAVKTQPRYVIEFVGKLSDGVYVGGSSASSLVISEEQDPFAGEAATGSTKFDYRITARGTGLTDDSEVIVQSTYRQDATPPTATP